MSNTSNTSRTWKAVCAVLIIVNAIALYLLFDTRTVLSDSEDSLADYRFSQAMLDAGGDFRAGKLRVYEIETHEYPAVGQPLYELKPTFTGRYEGSLEIWTYPRFRQDHREKFWLRLASVYVNTYNERMKILYQRRVGPKPVHVPDPTKGPPPGPVPRAGETNAIP